LKHILGLATKFGPKGFTLLYLWYGFQSLEAQRHWREIIEFEDIIKGDVDFRVMTYQDLFASILRIPATDQAYLDYLKTRYFSEGYNSFRDKIVAAEDKYGAEAANWDKLKGRMLGLKLPHGLGGTDDDIVSQLDVEVRDGLRIIRISGLTDKMNYRKAANIVGDMGFDKAASWIRKNPRLYQQLVERGFMNISQSLTTECKEGQE
jgi:hypothetical protein